MHCRQECLSQSTRIARTVCMLTQYVRVDEDQQLAAAPQTVAADEAMRCTDRPANEANSAEKSHRLKAVRTKHSVAG
jgi:hypothetical protein